MSPSIFILGYGNTVELVVPGSRQRRRLVNVIADASANGTPISDKVKETEVLQQGIIPKVRG